MADRETLASGLMILMAVALGVAIAARLLVKRSERRARRGYNRINLTRK